MAVECSQRALDVPREIPAYVTATATFLSLVYPNQGLERSLQQEHIERMNGRDFMKVMHVRHPFCLHTKYSDLIAPFAKFAPLA